MFYYFQSNVVLKPLVMILDYFKDQLTKMFQFYRQYMIRNKKLIWKITYYDLKVKNVRSHFFCLFNLAKWLVTQVLYADFLVLCQIGHAFLNSTLIRNRLKTISNVDVSLTIIWGFFRRNFNSMNLSMGTSLDVNLSQLKEGRVAVKVR